MKGLFAWVGFSQVTLDYDRAPRAAGVAKQNYGRLWALAIDGITSFSIAPLRFALLGGVLAASTAFALTIVYAVKTLMFGESVHGFPTLMVAILSLGGLNLLGRVSSASTWGACSWRPSTGRCTWSTSSCRRGDVRRRRRTPRQRSGSPETAWRLALSVSSVHAGPGGQGLRLAASIGDGESEPCHCLRPGGRAESTVSGGHRRSWHIVAVLIGMTSLQVSLTAFSLYVMSAVRAYVAGESLYSKGQKDAQIYLLDYAENHREVDYQRLIGALSVPIADRRAREELQKPAPDFDVARQAFIDGGNHPEDVAALVRLFRWFGRTPLMSDAIETWTLGDRVIEQMRQAAEKRAYVSWRARRTRKR